MTMEKLNPSQAAKGQQPSFLEQDFHVWSSALSFSLSQRLLFHLDFAEVLHNA